MTGISETTELRHPYNKAGDGPEGPEVRIVAEKLHQKISGCTLARKEKSDVAKVSGWDLLEEGFYVMSVGSYGKKVILDLGTVFVVVSLGMSGRMSYSRGRHWHVALTLERAGETVELFFEDSRRFGSFDIVPENLLHAYLQHLGPDLLQAALTKEMSTLEWNRAFHKVKTSRRKICDILIDQQFVAGIGWYLSVEILYFARVSPKRLACEVTEDEWERLRIIAHRLIQVSYSYGGFTIESFISPDGEKGMYPASIYGRNFDPQRRRVTREKFGTRTLQYVVEIQT